MATVSRLQDLVRRLADDSRGMVRSEIELAKLEMREKAQSMATGGAFLAVAAVLLGLMLMSLVLAAIWGLATTLSLWLSALIVAGALLVLALIAALVGRTLLRRGAPPVPEGAVAEAQLTVETLKEVRA
jgi:uncharacterized membrane protein YqjE